MEMDINRLLQEEGEIFFAGTWISLVDLPATKKEEIKITYSVDEMLDNYNDYMALYNLLNDEEYKQKAEEIKKKFENGG